MPLVQTFRDKHSIDVKLDMEELDVTSAESKETYEEIQAYVLNRTGMQFSGLYIAQVKRKCGIIEREDYNKAKTKDAKQPQCPVKFLIPADFLL